LSPKVFLNHRLVDSRHATISVFDHGFLYGDGIYETVRAYGTRVFHWPEHFQRLKQSARRIQLKCPWPSRFLLEGIRKVLRANRAPNGSVRISISRGAGPLGLDPALCPEPSLVMLLHPQRPVEALRRTGISIGIPDIRRNHPRCLDPRIKSNNSLNTILAKIEGKRLGVFESVLLNLDGFLTEGTTSNIFFVRRGQLFTPALSCGLLEGITREAVIRIARAGGWKVHEGRYRMQNLLRADEVFISSTTLEIMPVTKVHNAQSRWTVGKGRPGPVATQLQRRFEHYVQKELGL
jgi:branched-chain amino acid aminotransferase